MIYIYLEEIAVRIDPESGFPRPIIHKQKKKNSMPSSQHLQLLDQIVSLKDPRLLEQRCSRIAHNSSITKLELCKLEISDQQAKHIALAIQMNSTLLEISLSCNRIEAD
jgi:hypothetical protein